MIARGRVGEKGRTEEGLQETFWNNKKYIFFIMIVVVVAFV